MLGVVSGREVGMLGRYSPRGARQPPWVYLSGNATKNNAAAGAAGGAQGGTGGKYRPKHMVPEAGVLRGASGWQRPFQGK